jgi:hypothetical protein
MSHQTSSAGKLRMLSSCASLYVHFEKAVYHLILHQLTEMYCLSVIANKSTP